MTDASDRLPVAVVGVGRMGRHHARTYAKLAGAKLVAVIDRDLDRAGEVADEFGCEALASVEELLARHTELRAASVAVPTQFHAAAAEPLLRRGIPCLIEKPLAPTVDEARRIASLAAEHRALLQVGHTERFNPAVRAVAAMNLTPRFIEVDRVSPMTFRSLDVGVVMDLMIHDLDIVMMLARSTIAKLDAVGVAVMGEREDIADARITFANGCVANLTASRVALKTERKLRLFSESAYVSLDYQKRSGIVIRRTDNDAALRRVREQVAAGVDLSDVDYSELVQVSELSMDMTDGQSDPLTAELSSFLDAVRSGGAAEVDAEAGYAAVDAAQRVLAAIHAHQWEGREGIRV
jgi:predicted dehydrogenase